ncbi:tetratricopeptide repeat protein [Alteraurantiacibacter aestuarii]|uniref:Tetratricopeptide repeat protein n=1 Tax=Alteraurantiacibacter aestuarii TaxID=650004 RepID=A0A844ZKW2_9SPHN|nr:tetratricopeptide repeat protein [Alteraurantiacibacter aestuarii]
MTIQSGKPETRDLEQEMLMREVDEAVRNDTVGTAFKKYGVTAGIVLALGLASFAGYLYWHSSQEASLEEQSEQLVLAIDELDAGNLSVADEELAALSADGSPGAMASANMLRAAIALEQDRPQDAVAFYDRVANNADAPPPMRDAATVRSVAIQFDDMEPQAVIDRLGPLAVADSDWFGSAGELVAMAYLAQGREDQAGPLLVQIAKDEDVPQSLRARTRQLAGLLGFDAVEDVEETLAEMRGDDAEQAQGAAQ